MLEERNQLVANIKLNQFEEFEKNLSMETKINFKDVNGFTMLHYAVEYNRLRFIDLLFKKGHNLEVKNRNKVTPLLRCILNCSSENDFEIKTVKLLLELGANPNYKKSKSAYSMLHVAYMNKNILLIKLLLTHGANPNEALNRMKFTPLFFVYNVESMQVLLEKKVDVDVVDKKGSTVFSYLILLNDESIALDMTIKLSKFSKAINRDFYQYILKASTNGKNKIAEYFIDKYNASAYFNIDVNIIDAAKKSNTLLLRKLLEYLSEPEIIVETETGRTPLHYAVINNNIKMVKVLLDNGFAVTKEKDKLGKDIYEYAKDNLMLSTLNNY